MARIRFEIIPADEAPLPNDPALRYGEILDTAKLMKPDEFLKVPTSNDQERSEFFEYFSARAEELNCVVEQVDDGIGLWKKRLDATQRAARAKKRAPIRWTPSLLKEIYTDLRSRVPVREIASRLNCDASSIYIVIHANGSLNDYGRKILEREHLDPAQWPSLVPLNDNGMIQEQRRLLAELNTAGLDDLDIAGAMSEPIAHVGLWRVGEKQLTDGQREKIKMLIGERS